MSTRLGLVAIDLDGTLVDSVADLHAAVLQMQQTLDLEKSTEPDVRSWVGNGIERLVHRSMTHSMYADAEINLFNKGLDIFRDAYREINGSCSVLYPGVMPGLDWLESQNLPLVVVTNKAGCFARPLLEKLQIDHYFVSCIAGDDVKAGKPSPEGLNMAAEQCSALSRNCMLIGDSISDIKSAKAAGFLSVCVSYGYNHGQPVAELTGDLRPDAIVDTFLDLPDVFDQLDCAYY